jgi:hypothetical protein
VIVSGARDSQAGQGGRERVTSREHSRSGELRSRPSADSLR